MAKCGQMPPVNDFQTWMVFTLLKGCKINQRGICNGNLWPMKLKVFTVWLFTDQVCWGHCTAKHWQANRKHVKLTCLWVITHYLFSTLTGKVFVCLFNAFKISLGEGMTECLHVLFLSSLVFSLHFKNFLYILKDALSMCCET